MALFRVVEQIAVACDEREPMLARARNQKTIGRIAMDVPGKPCGFDENAVAESKDLQAIGALRLRDEIVDRLAEIESSTVGKPGKLKHRDGGYKQSPLRLRLC